MLFAWLAACATPEVPPAPSAEYASLQRGLLRAIENGNEPRASRLRTRLKGYNASDEAAARASRQRERDLRRQLRDVDNAYQRGEILQAMGLLDAACEAFPAARTCEGCRMERREISELVSGMVTAGLTNQPERRAELREHLEARFPSWTDPSSCGGHSSVGLASIVVGESVGTLDVARWVQGEVELGAGRPSVLVFWGPRCRQCEVELPALEERLAASGTTILGILRPKESTAGDDLRALVSTHGVTFPIGIDEGGLFERFEVKHLPVASILRDGVIVWRGRPAHLDQSTIELWLEETP